MTRIGKVSLAFAGVMLLLVVSSLIPGDKWFIRAVDLVREPMAYLTGLLLIASLVLGGSKRWITLVAHSLVIGINLWRIWPYSFLADTQLSWAEKDGVAPGTQYFSAMSVNVKVNNDQYRAISDQVRQHDPDVLLLMETHERWIKNLEPVLSAYKQVERHPQPEAFGVMFATRLPVLKSRVIEDTCRDTPTLYATLQPAGKWPIEFIGLHPKPPLPGWNTQLRNENIVNAGNQTPDKLPAAFEMGDFNDV